MCKSHGDFNTYNDKKDYPYPAIVCISHVNQINGSLF